MSSVSVVVGSLTLNVSPSGAVIHSLRQRTDPDLALSFLPPPQWWQRPSNSILSTSATRLARGPPPASSPMGSLPSTLLRSGLLSTLQRLSILPASWRAKAAERETADREDRYEAVPLVGRLRDEE